MDPKTWEAHLYKEGRRQHTTGEQLEEFVDYQMWKAGWPRKPGVPVFLEKIKELIRPKTPTETP
jgi:hypothetical protein